MAGVEGEVVFRWKNFTCVTYFKIRLTESTWSPDRKKTLGVAGGVVCIVVANVLPGCLERLALHK